MKRFGVLLLITGPVLAIVVSHWRGGLLPLFFWGWVPAGIIFFALGERRRRAVASRSVNVTGREEDLQRSRETT